MPNYQFFNVPVTAEIGSRYNPLTLLKAIAQPQDFVVVKLDIDQPTIEFALIDQILNDTSVSRLIDEFFFEHHSTAKELSGAWRGVAVRGDMAAGHRLFRQLRDRGIRAHSWV